MRGNPGPSLPVAGKLESQVLCAIEPASLLHITCMYSGDTFLIYTGASFSILPYVSKSPPTGPALSGPDGRSLACWGERTRTLAFGGQEVEWTFLLADIKFPILGVDFLRHFQLQVDPAANLLYTRDGRRRWPVHSRRSSPPSVEGGCARPPRPDSRPPGSSSVEGGCAGSSGPNSTPPGSSSQGRHSWPPRDGRYGISSVLDVLAEFPSVVNEAGCLPPATHGVQHHIVTSGRPVTAKFRRLDNVKLAAAKEEFQKLEAEGIIRRSDSCWASPLHMVQKADRSWRPCGDYRRLNLLTEPDCYPLPNMNDITSRLAGCTVFSKLDLKKGYISSDPGPAS